MTTLFDDDLISLTDKSLTSFLKENEKAVVLCWKDNCPYCDQFFPIVSTISQEMTGVTFAHIDVKKNKKTAKDLNVRTVPTLIVFQNGKVKKGIIGMKSKVATERDIRLAFAVTFV